MAAWARGRGEFCCDFLSHAHHTHTGCIRLIHPLHHSQGDSNRSQGSSTSIPPVSVGSCWQLLLCAQAASYVAAAAARITIDPRVTIMACQRRKCALKTLPPTAFVPGTCACLDIAQQAVRLQWTQRQLPGHLRPLWADLGCAAMTKCKRPGVRPDGSDPDLRGWGSSFSIHFTGGIAATSMMPGALTLALNGDPGSRCSWTQPALKSVNAHTKQSWTQWTALLHTTYRHLTVPNILSIFMCMMIASQHARRYCVRSRVEGVQIDAVVAGKARLAHIPKCGDRGSYHV